MENRISQLPQPLVHHILSFLSQKEAVQTCVLSKSWRHVWSTRPKLEFRISLFNRCLFDRDIQGFTSALTKTLQGYHDQKFSVHHLRLEMFELDSDTTLFLDKWIPILILNMGVKTFHLSFLWDCFDLPPILFQAQSLQKLYLQQCKILKFTDKVMLLTNLQTLTLSRVHIEDETFEKIMASCPLIEYVFLDNCSGLRAIKVNKKDHILKGFDSRGHHVFMGLRDHSIEIDAPSLENITIIGCPNWFHHDQIQFPKLKSLFLQKVRLCSKSFDLFSSNLPCLEDLSLYGCFGFEEFQLSNNSVKRLVVWGTDKAIEATIDAPKLIKFDYNGKIPPSITFASAPCCYIHLWFDVDIDNFATSWLRKLRKLLDMLSGSQVSLNFFHLSRGAVNDQDQHLTEDGNLDNNNPVVVEHLNLSLGGHSSPSLSAVFDCMFRVCRPRYIGKLIYANPVAQFLCKILVIDRRVTEQYLLWQQDIEDVSMEIFDTIGKEWRCVQMSNIQDGGTQDIRFRLKWKEIK